MSLKKEFFDVEKIKKCYLYNPLNKHKEIAMLGDSILTYQLYLWLIKNNENNIITSEWLQNERNHYCSNYSLSLYYDNHFENMSKNMILQGKQTMTMKMKATFVEAYIWYINITSEDEMKILVEHIFNFLKNNRKN